MQAMLLRSFLLAAAAAAAPTSSRDETALLAARRPVLHKHADKIVRPPEKQRRRLALADGCAVHRGSGQGQGPGPQCAELAATRNKCG